MRMYCNPLNISYKYQHPENGKYAYREGADPTLIYFKGMYYMFVSMSAGFYYSADLVEWKYHEDRELEIYSYAPDVSTDGRYMYFCASERFRKSKILKTENPFDGFEYMSSPFAFWDPHIFFDKDIPYLFWGCSNRTPIYGLKLSSKMLPLEKKHPLIFADEKNNGAEQKNAAEDKNLSVGEKFINLILGKKPFIEGAFLNEREGKYYLQYACPGTELPTYCDCVYTSDEVLGDYTLQRHNPYSVVPGGFATGAGHGSTIEDMYGNLWHASTIGICVNHNFERRVGIWPAGVDDDGILFCNQYFSDYPKRIPDGKFNPLDIEPEWMLLSYKKAALVSSQKKDHPPRLALDESIKTCWCAQTGNSGEWYRLDLGDICTVNAVQINFADSDIPKMKVKKSSCGGTIPLRRYIDTSEQLKTQWILEGSPDGVTWETLCDKSCAKTDLSHDFIVFENGVNLRFLKLTFVLRPYSALFALSGFRVFGTGSKNKPGRVSVSSAKMTNPTAAALNWEKSEGAVGYNIRLGIASDKLYNSIMVYDDTGYNITFLNRKAPCYYYCIDSFNENGITKGDVNRID